MKYLVFSLIALLNTLAHGLSKEEALAQISAMNKQNQSQLEELDRNLKTQFQGPNADEGKIKALSFMRTELSLRQNLYDRLKFQIESHYKGQNFKTFLPQTLKDMALQEAKNGYEPAMWPFINQLAQTIEQNSSKDRDVLIFIEQLITKSSIQRPQSLQAVVPAQDYDNGRDQYKANSVDRENVGDAVEKQLSDL